MKLKHHLLASALCVLPFAASAADLPVKAPYRVVQPVPFTWTGFYVGGSAGFISQSTTVSDEDGLLGGAGEQFGVSGHGGIFGVNAGYNWQLAPNWVLGLETDISGSTVDNAFNFTSWAGSQFAANSSVSSKLNSLGTIRARIGYAFDRALLYATGGWAYGHVENRASYDQTAFSTASTDDWRSGWTVGGGLEYGVTNNWTVRAEGLYVDLGNAETAAPRGCRFGFKNTYTLGRLGLNYKF